MSQLKILFAKYKKGEPLTDDEIKYMLPQLRETRDTLQELGPEYHHAWFDLAQHCMTLARFQTERKRA